MIIRLIILSGISLLITSCTTVQSDQTSGDTALSRQLEQLTSELSELRKEVVSIKERFEKLDQQVNPKPQLVAVDFDNDPVLGSKQAKVGIVEFSDYQCPFCQRFHTEVFPMMKKDYIDTGKMLMVYRDLPLEFHPLAKEAAVVANCAGEQGHYWYVQEAFFSKQDQIGDALYTEIAAHLKLDIDKFSACRKDASQLKEIEDDLAYGNSIGVSGTPTFFIGRVEGDRLVDALPVVGAQPYPVLIGIIESYLNGKEGVI